MSTIIALLAILSTAFCDKTLPAFSWDSDGPEAIPLLRITFPDGLQDDLAILERYNPIPVGPAEREEDIDQCIYHGYLKSESDVYVTVTGCENSQNFQVQFRSKRLIDYMFQVENGVVSAVPSIFRENDRGEQVRDEEIHLNKNIQFSRGSSVDRALNTNGYVLNVKVRYDTNFLNKFGADSVNAARRVMAQAQNIFKWKSSLTTTVTFSIDPTVNYVAGSFYASTDITKVGPYASGSYNTNIFLGYRNNQPGTVGIAYVGVVCLPTAYAKYKTALCEYYYNDLYSGQIVAHEIGHNLGMNHDFNNGNPSDTRYDSLGRSCSKIGGVMDYYGAVTKWSTCSVEDFTKYFNYNQPFCLRAL